MADSSPEPMASAPSSPLPTGAQSPPPLSDNGNMSGDEMAMEDNRFLDQPDALPEEDPDGDDLLENIEK